VDEADTARSAKRAAAARQIGDLAHQRAIIAEQLDDIERQLGEVLVAAQKVIDVDELAHFTDVPAGDLTRWLTARKTTRTKRRKPTRTTSGIPGTVNRDASPAGSTAAHHPSPVARSSASRPGTIAPAQVDQSAS
jgi:hypothetical protein